MDKKLDWEQWLFGVAIGLVLALIILLISGSVDFNGVDNEEAFLMCSDFCDEFNREVEIYHFGDSNDVLCVCESEERSKITVVG